MTFTCWTCNSSYHVAYLLYISSLCSSYHYLTIKHFMGIQNPQPSHIYTEPSVWRMCDICSSLLKSKEFQSRDAPFSRRAPLCLIKRNNTPKNDHWWRWRRLFLYSFTLDKAHTLSAWVCCAFRLAAVCHRDLSGIKVEQIECPVDPAQSFISFFFDHKHDAMLG